MAEDFGTKFGQLVAALREHSGLTQAELAKKIDLTPVALSRLENGHVRSPRSNTISALIEHLPLTLGDVAALRDGESTTVILEKRLSRSDSEADQRLEAALLSRYDTLGRALLSLGDANRDELELLASRFGADTPKDQTDEELREFLTLKAEEYVAYKALIDGLDERVAAIGNLKAAAQHAAEQLNFDEVESLLGRVDEVETTIAAETKEARASNALLRGRPDQAYAIFGSAADAFRELDLREYARRRSSYFEHLYNPALRYGGPGLSLAADIEHPRMESHRDRKAGEDEIRRVRKRVAPAVGRAERARHHQLQRGPGVFADGEDDQRRKDGREDERDQRDKDHLGPFRHHVHLTPPSRRRPPRRGFPRSPAWNAARPYR